MSRKLHRNSNILKMILMLILISSCMIKGNKMESADERHSSSVVQYTDEWESLQQHPDPEWFRDAKFGIYTHWGPYSVPEWGDEWYARRMYLNKKKKNGNFYVFHKERYGDPADFGYKDLIPLFTADNFDADEWADLFVNSGAKFAGPVAEHHDGFAMWDSDLTKWDAMDMGPRRDIVGELGKALKGRGMKFVTSFHHARKWWWYEVSFTEDKRYDTEDPKYAGVYKIYPPVHTVEDPPSREYMQAWEEKVIEVIDKYEPDLLWFDSGLQREKFWRSSLQEFDGHKRSFLSYYYNKGLKWGKEVGVTYKDEDLPKGAGILDFERGRIDALSKFIWLTDTSIDEKSWSYVENPRYKPINELVDILVDIVSKNGCLLLNVGPRADGTFPDEVKKRLLGLGDWLKVNGDAIYGTRPWVKYGEGPTRQRGGAFSEKKNKVSYTAKDIRFTTRGDTLYAIVLDHPGNEETVITSLSNHNQIGFGKVESVSLLGSEEQIQWEQTNDGLMITVPRDYNESNALAFKIIPKEKK